MRITHTEIYRLSIPMVPFAIATGTMDYAQNVFVRLHTDAGLYGVGECSAFPMIVGETQETCLAVGKDFARIWKGKSPLDIGERMQELHHSIAGNSTIKSAFDMCLFDLAAKAAGQPLWQYLGGAKREVETDVTIGIGSVDQMVEQALQLTGQGARILKIKLGKEPNGDLARLREIRRAIGSQVLVRIDANQGWSYDNAAFILPAMEELDIAFCEQPMHRRNDHLLPRLRAQTSVKIMADESCYDRFDAERLIAAGACDSINIKLAKTGGILEALKVHDAARQAHIPCMIGGMLESRIALSANLHLAYACPGIIYYDMDSCMIGHLEDPASGGVSYNGYQLTITDTPGIGADASESFLKHCERIVV